MPPLRRIFSISAADLRIIAIVHSHVKSGLTAAGYSPARKLSMILKICAVTLVYRQVSVHGNQPSFAS